MQQKSRLFGAVGSVVLFLCAGCGPAPSASAGEATAIDGEDYSIRPDGWRWPLSHVVTWRITGVTGADIDPPSSDVQHQVWNAVSFGSYAWTSKSGLQFAYQSTGAVDIEIKFGNISVPTALAETNETTHDIIINKLMKWSVTDFGGIAENRYDLQSVITHELGHAFGLYHSTAYNALMQAALPKQLRRRGSVVDDQVAISMLYDVYTTDNSAGNPRDIAAGADGSVWITAADQTLKKWNGTAWVGTECCGNRIAVANDGTPWILALNGTIWHMKTVSPPSWEQIAGCGYDIGVNYPHVYVLACDSVSGGHTIMRYHVGSKSWSGHPTGGIGTRISVAWNGDVWWVNDRTDIYSAGAFDTSWTYWGSGGIDIAVGPFTSQDLFTGSVANFIYYPFLTATDQTIWTVNAQLGDPHWDYDPAVNTWRRVEDPLARGVSVAVNVLGQPYTVGASGGGIRRPTL